MIPSGLARVQGPVCGVFAVAVAANKPFDEVFAYAKKALHKRSSWRGRMYFRELRLLLVHKGVRHTDLEGFEGYSLARAVAELDPTAHHIVNVTGHFLTVFDGKCYDQSHPTGEPIATYWGKKKRLRNIVLKVLTTH